MQPQRLVSSSCDVIPVAMIQMLVEGGRKAANLARAEQLIAKAAKQGARVVVLPEAFTLGWTHPSARSEAEPIPAGPSCALLADCARSHRIYICAGIIEQTAGRIYNAAVLLGPAGELLLHHRKINELDFAQGLYSRGDRLGVADTEFGRFGLMICADGFARDLVPARALGQMGAEIILSPCAWAVPPGHCNATEPYGQLWLDSYGPVCREYGLFIVGVSNVGNIPEGPWAGRKCIGCSLVVGPDGKQVVMGPYGKSAETVIHVNLQRRFQSASLSQAESS